MALNWLAMRNWLVMSRPSGFGRSVRLVDEGFADPARYPLEIVERKGLGHPDTLADLVADEFIRRYAKNSIADLGVIPNVSVDKLTLVGSLARLRLGSYVIERNARALLVGKITRRVGRVELPIEELFRDSLTSVLGQAGLSGLLDHLSLEVINNDRLTDDHARQMYQPPSIDDVRPAEPGRWESADTACISFEGPATPLERLVVELEQELTSDTYRAANPELGTDVKILAFRRDRVVDVTMCVPMKATAVSTMREYRDAVERANLAVLMVGDRYAEHFKTEFFVNTKDIVGSVYLTAFGSSLDKGDQGAVGRGNGALGVNAIERRKSAEAVAGKNPFHHPAKIYTEICRAVVAEVQRFAPVPMRVAVTCRNGEPLVNPSHVAVQLDQGSAPGAEHRALVRDVVSRCGEDLLDRLPEVSTGIALRDPVGEFRAAQNRLLDLPV